MSQLLERMVRLSRSGQTTRQIADVLGLTVDQVAGRMSDPSAPDPPLGGADTATLDVRVEFGAAGDGVTDDRAAIQSAIDHQQRHGGVVYLSPGHYRISSGGLVPAPGDQFAWEPPTRPLLIAGAGMDSSVLVAGDPFPGGGMLAYGRSGSNPVCAKVIASGLTFDGNCVDGGGQLAAPGDLELAGALVSLPAPWTDIADDGEAPEGRYHSFTRCRFWRPTGYGFQPTQMVRLIDCEFDHVGQPSGTFHRDCLGSGWGDAIIIGCSWHDSAGNYVDFVHATGKVRVVMLGCVSAGHAEGGLYACGDRSVIVGNRLRNVAPGSGGVGYDVDTGLRRKNVVVGNVFENIYVDASGLDPNHNDLVFGNVSADQTKDGVIELRGLLRSGGLILTEDEVGSSGAPNVHGDGQNAYLEASNGSLFLRPTSGSNTRMVQVAGDGLRLYDGAGQGQSAFFSGDGEPASALGADGDFYFRSDTPGVAGQRIYAKAAGAWAGIA